MKQNKILLVEDDPALGFVIKDNLMMNNFAVELCDNGELALEAFENGVFELCILDIMLPKIDGFAVAERIRSKNKQIPIIFLSAKSLNEDKIAGFKLGADDYITKPFSMEELICRIEVFLKRSSPNADLQNVWEIGNYTFNNSEISLKYKDELIQLTRRESELLQFLCENKEVVTKREEILMKLWGEDDYFKGRSLDVFISKLRKYLSKDPKVDIINYHGVGFKLEIKP
ncbi:response regulator transcription factor [Reichenbachiella sp. MALMAid0571]|uniref:response regulator transcription factor n=1 Tax=Reichenbachiella sp. MALMAid0571 TaxID=3143939 RepID=UPI0032E00A08